MTREYYLLNRASILAKQHARYEADSEFRRRKIEAARARPDMRRNRKYTPEALRRRKIVQREYGKTPEYGELKARREAKKCLINYCPNWIRYGYRSSVCISCLHFANWLCGGMRAVANGKGFEALQTTTAYDKEKYLCLKTKQQAQRLRKRLLKTLQSQISEGQAGLLGS